MKPAKKLLLQAAALTGAVTSSITWAQTALEEVIVTAQKREQSLQDAPLAVTAFGAKDVAQRGIYNIQDIGLFVPNVQVAPNPGGATSSTFAIRGSTTINPAITWEATVGMYLDGVFIGKNLGGIFDVADLDRVEVLRGPQGTLYGKNTIAGAINLITRKPGEEFDAYAEVGAGNFGSRMLRARVDTGASGTVGEGLGSVRATVAYSKRERDGFYDNVALDPTFGNNPFVGSTSSSELASLDTDAFRLDVIADVTDTFSVRYNYNESNADNLPNLGQVTNVDPAVYGSFGLGDFAGLHALYLTDGNGRADEISNDYAIEEVSETKGHSLTMTWDLGDATLTSITARRDLDWRDQLDIDGTNMDLFHSGRDTSYEQFSQELQLSGSNDSINYVAGLYYFSEEGDIYNPISFFGLFGSPTDNNEYGLDNRSFAIYGQADWVVSSMPELTLTAGLRYTSEDKDQYIIHPNASTGGAGAFDVTADDSWSNVTGTLIASYAFTDDSTGYAKISQGWKAGGFNGEAPTADAFFESFDPEEVLAFEVGYKARLADDRVEINAAAFWNDISDMQFSVFLEGSGGAASTVDNAGAATIRGIEIEMAAQLTDTIKLSANVGTLDTEYDEFIELGVDVKDSKDFPYAPETTASVALDWAMGSGPWGRIDTHIDWNYKDDYVVYANRDQNVSGQIASYDVVNARLTWSGISIGDSAKLQVSAWGKNIFDEEYRENTIPFGLWTISYWGAPATYGVDARITF